MLYHRDKRTLIYGMWDSKLSIFPLRVQHYDDEQQTEATLTHEHRAKMYHNQFDDGTFVMAYNNDDPACVWYGMTVVEDIEEYSYERAMYNHCTNEVVKQTYSNGARGAQLVEHEIVESAGEYDIPTGTEELVELLEKVLNDGIEVIENRETTTVDETSTEPKQTAATDDEMSLDGFQSAADAR